ncbi:MAG: hypothetical protein HYR90_02550 [Candidatus Andersenbacteria bacterium]|nr:hypothetical protein [Candidatus Andersenbacteria bacterium]MBI3251037.1 hypothetical protein [Candidatus Andersenbacteria bacterium]
MSEESLKSVLAPVLKVLKDLGGKFVFSDDTGETFVIMSKKELVKNRRQSEKQLPLLSAEATAKAVREHVPIQLDEEIIENINRDIALSLTSEDSDENLAWEAEPVNMKKVRFESLKGDISPDLQD